MDYEDYEKACDEIRKENENYLNLFLEGLQRDGLSEKTINSHMGNADFYINDFLLCYDPIRMKDGTVFIGEFLGDFFIRKCMWSTPGNIKTTATSIKKFYKFMLANNEIAKADYDVLCEIIKSEMDEWQNLCERFNDIDEVNPFNPFGFGLFEDEELLLVDEISADEANRELTMVLMYLNRFTEGRGFPEDEFHAWKGYDFGIINELADEDYIRQGKNPSRTKSVYITKSGENYAKQLMDKYCISEES